MYEIDPKFSRTVSRQFNGSLNSPCLLTHWGRMYSVGMTFTREEILAKVAAEESLKEANLSEANDYHAVQR